MGSAIPFQMQGKKKEVWFNSLIDLLNSFYLSTSQANSSTSEAQLTGSKLLNHSDSAGHCIVSFPSVISPQAIRLSLVLNNALWSIDWPDYQGEKN